MPVENSKNGRRGPLKTGRFFASSHGASFIILVFDEQPRRRALSMYSWNLTDFTIMHCEHIGQSHPELLKHANRGRTVQHLRPDWVSNSVSLSFLHVLSERES